MQPLTYPIANILQINKDEIIFRDEQHKTQHIDLKQCSENYAAEFNAHIDDYINWDGSPVEPYEISTCRCVGARDWFAEKPYFVFYTTPRIIFDITMKSTLIDRIFHRHSWQQRYYPEFCAVSTSLEKHHWTTFDLG